MPKANASAQCLLIVFRNCSPSPVRTAVLSRPSCYQACQNPQLPLISPEDPRSSGTLSRLGPTQAGAVACTRGPGFRHSSAEAVPGACAAPSPRNEADGQEGHVSSLLWLSSFEIASTHVQQAIQYPLRTGPLVQASQNKRREKVHGSRRKSRVKRRA